MVCFATTRWFSTRLYWGRRTAKTVRFNSWSPWDLFATLIRINKKRAKTLMASCYIFYRNRLCCIRYLADILLSELPRGYNIRLVWILSRSLTLLLPVAVRHNASGCIAQKSFWAKQTHVVYKTTVLGLMCVKLVWVKKTLTKISSPKNFKNGEDNCYSYVASPKVFHSQPGNTMGYNQDVYLWGDTQTNIKHVLFRLFVYIQEIIVKINVNVCRI